jgi:hypothetical protein
MPTEQPTGEIKTTSEVKTVSTSGRRSEAWLLLVFLILVGIAGIAALCYKLQNPTVNVTIEDR